jgi:hypothetical protein
MAMKKRGINKKAQEVLGMSFGMIFSIILIVFFIVVAFIAINAFLKTQRCTQIGIFITDFKDEVKKAFNSPKEDFVFTRTLPSNLKQVCFYDSSKKIIASGEEKEIADNIGIYQGKNANMFFYPREKSCNIPYANVDYLDIEKTAGLDNLKCFEVKDGEISIQILKGMTEKLVRLN